MRNFMDELENAAYTLQDMSKKAVQTASGRFEEVRPAIQEGIDKAREGAKAAYEKARPAIEEGLSRAKNALEDVFDGLKPNDAPAEEAEAPDDESETAQQGRPLTPDEQLDLEVDERIKKIRAAQRTKSPFGDYISQKYGGKDD